MTKKENLGLPYMGSKRKLASAILAAIYKRHPKMTNFYDLFGGGGSVSFTAARDYRFAVHYNELNRHILSLVSYLKENKDLDQKFYQWVTREEFFNQITKTNDEADWFSGFVMSCWSFGNSQRSYLYGADIEDVKRLAHEFIVNDCLDSMNAIGVNIPELLKVNGVQNRRLAFCSHIKKNAALLEYGRMENLEMLENLTRLQNLQNLQNLQITNLSYEKVEIIGSDPVLYCDIPYKGTRKYKEGGFNHDAFYEWFANLEHPAYMSEYDAPFKKVEMFKHRSIMSATNTKKKVFESVFWNGKGDVTQQTLFA